VPGDLIQKAFANFPVRPEAADPDADPRGRGVPVQRHNDEARLEALGRPRVEKAGVGQRAFLIKGISRAVRAATAARRAPAGPMP
jgi:hypothetical protein